MFWIKQGWFHWATLRFPIYYILLLTNQNLAKPLKYLLKKKMIEPIDFTPTPYQNY